MNFVNGIPHSLSGIVQPGDQGQSFDHNHPGDSHNMYSECYYNLRYGTSHIDPQFAHALLQERNIGYARQMLPDSNQEPLCGK
jgi:hypothetical protein